MRKPILLAATAGLVLLPGCQLGFTERTTGTAIGTAGGALTGGLLGAAVGSPATGAILGGIAGGAAGYIIGDWMADKRERQQAQPAQGPAYAQAPAPAYDGTEAAAYPGPVGTPGAIAVSGPGATSKARADMARREYEAGRRATDAGEALRHYQEASRLDPSRPEPHNARGIVLLHLERRPEARAAFQRALSVDGTYAPAQQNLARMNGGA